MHWYWRQFLDVIATTPAEKNLCLEEQLTGSAAFMSGHVWLRTSSVELDDVRLSSCDREEREEGEDGEGGDSGKVGETFHIFHTQLHWVSEIGFVWICHTQTSSKPTIHSLMDMETSCVTNQVRGWEISGSIAFINPGCFGWLPSSKPT